jgi:hypothetical protein
VRTKEQKKEKGKKERNRIEPISLVLQLRSPLVMGIRDGYC